MTNTEKTNDAVVERRALTDSPWFWAHLFCVAGLIAIFLMQGKYGERQAQLERQYQGRQHAVQKSPGEESTSPYSDEDNTLIKLSPLFWLLVTGVIGTWGGLWWTHFRRPESIQEQRRLPNSSTTPNKGETIMSSFFFENPWAIAFAGILLVTALVGSWLQTGKNGLLIGAILAGLVTGVLLFVERSVVTENERVEATIYQLAKIVESGDLSALINHIHPDAADVRARASGEFPKYKVKEVRIKSGMKVEVSPNHEPPKAVAEFNVMVVGVDIAGLVADQNIPRFVVLTFYKDGNDWKVWNYEHHEFTHGMSGAGANP